MTELLSNFSYIPYKHVEESLLKVHSIQSFEKLQLKPSDRKFYRSGAWYIGNLDKNQRIGWGQFKWSKGGFYEGYYKNNKRHGEGKHYLSDGSIYIGSFKNDFRHGHGELTWKDGERYKGQFVDDKRHGYGVYSWPDGRCFEGNFENNKKSGFGVYSLANGDRFEGIYKNDTRDGPGIFTYKVTGHQDIGIWKGSLLIKLCSVIRSAFSYRFFMNHHINAGENGDIYDEIETHKNVVKIKSGKSSPKKKEPIAENEAENTAENTVTKSALEMFPLNDILNGTRPTNNPKGPIETASEDLLNACSNGDFVLAREILREGRAHPDVCDKNGYFSILGAAVNCHIDILNCLLDQGADINRLNNEKLSALSACHNLFYTQQNFIENIAENMAKENLFNSVEYEKKTGTIINRNERKLIIGIYESLYQPYSTVKRFKKEVTTKSNKMENYHRRRMSRLNSLAFSQSSKSSANKTVYECSTDEDENSEGYFDPWKLEYYQKSMDRVKEVDEINRTFKDFMLSSYRVKKERHNETTPLPEPIEIEEYPDEIQGKFPRPSPTTAASVFGYDAFSKQSRYEVKERSCVSRAAQDMFRKHISNERKPHLQNVISLLLQRGANPNSSSLPMPVLFFAVKSADPEAVTALLKQNANTSAKLDGQNLCPLHIAVALPTAESIEITKILLEYGADPNLRDGYFEENIDDGRTPLHIVCCREDNYKDAQKIAKLLLQHGADPNLLCLGNSALSLAIASGNDLIVDTLLRHRADPSLKLTHGLGSILCTAVSFQAERKRLPNDRMKLIEKLVNAGADMLTPVRVSDKYPPCTVVDYAYHIFSQDRRIACTPYHALSSLERECYNARKTMLEKLGVYLRISAKEKENEILIKDMTRMQEGQKQLIESTVSSKRPAHQRKYSKVQNGPGRDETCGLRFVTIKTGSRKITRMINDEMVTVTIDKIKKLRYCYECGRSIGIRLTPCTRCKEVFYCSKACKIKAWNETHREECSRLTVFKTTTTNHRGDSPTPTTDVTRELNEKNEHFLPQI